MSPSEPLVECGTHGQQNAAYVCRHLVAGSKLGFNWGRDPDSPDEQCPDAWCDACEAILDAEGEWTERATDFAGIELICTECYEIVRDRNWLYDEVAFDRLVAEACQYLESAQDVLRKQYCLDDYERYDWNQETGQLVFSHGGIARVIADIVFVGSLSTVTNTWLWSWANSSLWEHVKAPMREVRDMGDKHRYYKLAAAHWSAVETDGWNMTAVAAQLLKAKGAYRTPSERGFTFMVVNRVNWVQ